MDFSGGGESGWHRDGSRISLECHWNVTGMSFPTPRGMRGSANSPRNEEPALGTPPPSISNFSSGNIPDLKSFIHLKMPQNPLFLSSPIPLFHIEMLIFQGKKSGLALEKEGIWGSKSTLGIFLCFSKVSKGVGAAAAPGTMSRCPSRWRLFLQGHDPGHSHPGAFLAQGFSKVFPSQKTSTSAPDCQCRSGELHSQSFSRCCPGAGIVGCAGSCSIRPQTEQGKGAFPQNCAGSKGFVIFWEYWGVTILGSHGNIPQSPVIPLTLWVLGGASRAVTLWAWL